MSHLKQFINFTLWEESFRLEIEENLINKWFYSQFNIYLFFIVFQSLLAFRRAS